MSSDSSGPPSPAIRRFRHHIVRLWLGQVATGLGDQLHSVALVWIAVESVGERAGWVIAAGAISRLTFGFAGGAFADRWDRQGVQLPVYDLSRGSWRRPHRRTGNLRHIRPADRDRPWRRDAWRRRTLGFNGRISSRTRSDGRLETSSRASRSGRPSRSCDRS